MTNLLERAVSTDDADRAAKIIQNAVGIESRRSRQLLVSQNLAEGSRAAREDHR
jgi:hypothetical protein